MKKWSWVLLLLAQLGWAQKKWTGNNGTAYWNDPLNWEGDQVPGETDLVILDNSYFGGSYEVILPDTEVIIHALEIAPAAPHVIRLLLPPSNTVAGSMSSPAAKAFSTRGSGYSVLLRRNASFINASGSASGYSIDINDSLRIENGGRYIHRTRTGHADFLSKLSRDAGTEHGVFRMENTDAASTISISGRVFGSLELSSVSSPTGTTTYSAAGTNPVIIRGHLALDSGTNFSIHFGDTIHVEGDLLMRHAIFNLSTGNRNSCLRLKGNWEQIKSQLVETNETGHAGTLLLSALQQQSVTVTGAIIDSIRVVVDNPAGVRLLSSWVLPYELQLKRGLIYMGDSILQLAAGARIVLAADADRTGIDGAVFKVFDAGETMLLPLAKEANISYLSVQGYMGEFQAEYHRADANIPSQQLAAGLAEISSLEYWTIDAKTENQIGQPQFEFSYVNGQSGELFDTQQLTVASYLNGQWEAIGERVIPDAVGIKGKIQTVGLTASLLRANRYTIANKVGGNNLLPVLLENNWLIQVLTGWEFHWVVSRSETVSSFDIEFSEDGRLFHRIDEVLPVIGKTRYVSKVRSAIPDGYCRLKIKLSTQEQLYGPILKLRHPVVKESVEVKWVPASGGLQVYCSTAGLYQVEIFNRAGQLLFKGLYKQAAGTAYYAVPAIRPSTRGIIIRITDSKGVSKTIQQSW